MKNQYDPGTTAQFVDDVLKNEFKEKVKNIPIDWERKACFDYLLNLGTPREIMAENGKKRTHIYFLLTKHEITVEYKENAYEEASLRYKKRLDTESRNV